MPRSARRISRVRLKHGRCTHHLRKPLLTISEKNLKSEIETKITFPFSSFSYTTISEKNLKSEIETWHSAIDRRVPRGRSARRISRVRLKPRKSPFLLHRSARSARRISRVRLKRSDTIIFYTKYVPISEKNLKSEIETEKAEPESRREIQRSARRISRVRLKLKCARLLDQEDSLDQREESQE